MIRTFTVKAALAAGLLALTAACGTFGEEEGAVTAGAGGAPVTAPQTAQVDMDRVAEALQRAEQAAARAEQAAQRAEQQAERSQRTFQQQLRK